MPRFSILRQHQWEDEYEFPQGRVWQNYFAHQQWLWGSPTFQRAGRLEQRHLQRVLAEVIEEEDESQVIHHSRVYRQLTGTQAYATAERLEALALSRHYIESNPSWPTEQLVEEQLRQIRLMNSLDSNSRSVSGSSITGSSNTSESSSGRNTSHGYCEDESSDGDDAQEDKSDLSRENHTSDDDVEEDRSEDRAEIVPGVNAAGGDQRDHVNPETDIISETHRQKLDDPKPPVLSDSTKQDNLSAGHPLTDPEEAQGAPATAATETVHPLPGTIAHHIIVPESASLLSYQTNLVLADDEEDVVLQRKEVELLRAEIALMKAQRNLKRKQRES